MELRVHPRTEGAQRCLSFQVSIDPRARMSDYRDYLGNIVHHFDVPGKHARLRIVAESLVEVQTAAEPPARLGAEACAELDELVVTGDSRTRAAGRAAATAAAAVKRMAKER